MKANTSAAMSAEDFDALAVALDKVATFAPAGYTNWASIAKDGASAAHAQSLDGVKASCRGCHNQYKDKYKKEMRDRPIRAPPRDPVPMPRSDPFLAPRFPASAGRRASSRSTAGSTFCASSWRPTRRG